MDFPAAHRGERRLMVGQLQVFADPIVARGYLVHSDVPFWPGGAAGTAAALTVMVMS